MTVRLGLSVALSPKRLRVGRTRRYTRILVLFSSAPPASASRNIFTLAAGFFGRQLGDRLGHFRRHAVTLRIPTPPARTYAQQGRCSGEWRLANNSGTLSSAANHILQYFGSGTQTNQRTLPAALIFSLWGVVASRSFIVSNVKMLVTQEASAQNRVGAMRGVQSCSIVYLEPQCYFSQIGT